MRKAFVIYITWLIVINLFAFYSLNRFNLKADTAYSWINPSEFRQVQSLNLIDLRMHWDSFWYLKIATEGYQYIPGQMTSIAFFPLYPALIWVLSFIISPALAGWFISTVALGIGVYFLYKLVKENYPGIDPPEPIFLLLIFPAAFFLQAIYTESLFLALSIVFFYYLLKRNFLLAAVFLSLTSLCRINGLFLFLPFTYEYFKSYGGRFFNHNLLSFLIAPLGILSFMAYQYIRFGEPLAFLKSQMEWGRRFELSQEHLQLFSSTAYANLTTDLLFFTFGIITGLLLLRLRVSFGLYVLTTVLAAVSTGTLMSINRFVLTLFPIFILLASVRNKEFKYGWQLLSVLMLAAYTALFVNDYWAG